MHDLFFGSGIAHSILLLAVVIASGLWLGRFKVKGVSIGTTWILFLGILLSHFGLRSDPVVLTFMKDFGLILFDCGDRGQAPVHARELAACRDDGLARRLHGARPDVVAVLPVRAVLHVLQPAPEVRKGLRRVAVQVGDGRCAEHPLDFGDGRARALCLHELLELGEVGLPRGVPRQFPDDQSEVFAGVVEVNDAQDLAVGEHLLRQLLEPCRSVGYELHPLYPRVAHFIHERVHLGDELVRRLRAGVVDDAPLVHDGASLLVHPVVERRGQQLAFPRPGLFAVLALDPRRVRVRARGADAVGREGHREPDVARALGVAAPPLPVPLDDPLVLQERDPAVLLELRQQRDGPVRRAAEVSAAPQLPRLGACAPDDLERAGLGHLHVRRLREERAALRHRVQTRRGLHDEAARRVRGAQRGILAACQLGECLVGAAPVRIAVGEPHPSHHRHRAGPAPPAPARPGLRLRGVGLGERVAAVGLHGLL